MDTRSSSPSDGAPESLEGVWRALSDPTRRGILDLLRSGARTTGDVCGAFPGLTRFAVMKHMRVLEGAGLVVVRREGRQRWNHLNAVPLRRVYERWVSPFADAWAGSLLGLGRLVEGRGTEGAGMSKGVEEVAARAFILESEVVVRAPRERVYRALTEETERWFWRGADGKNPVSRMEARVGGRFYQDRGEGRGVLYGTVAAVEPPGLLRLIGDMGGLERALHCVITFRLTEEPGSTRVRVTQRGVGEYDAAYLGEYEQGWKDELEALRVCAEGLSA